VPLIPLDVDRPLIGGRLVKTVEPFLNPLLFPLDLDNSSLRVGFQIAPCVEDAILHQAHEARRWLESRELVDEHLFEFRFADVRRAASTVAVVVI